MQECGRAGRDGKPAKCILCMCCSLCISTKPSTAIDITISVYSYWDTLRAISGAPPDKYAPAIKRAFSVIKMAEAPWTCRRIPILSYYNEPPDPAYTCGNCDVCFAADPDLPYTTNIEQAVEHIQEFFNRLREDQFGTVTRAKLHKTVGSSQHGPRVVEYLVFKGILKESPYVQHGKLNCYLLRVASKIIQGSQDLFTNKPKYRLPFWDSYRPPPCLFSALHGFQNFRNLETLQWAPGRRRRPSVSGYYPPVTLKMPILWSWMSQKMCQRMWCTIHR